MLSLVTKISATPGSEAIVAAAVTVLVKSTQSETGCLRFEGYAAIDDPHSFWLVEQWKNRETHNAHLSGPGFQAFTNTVTIHLSAAPTLTFLKTLGH